MVSHPEVNRRLQRFVCVRMDWEQMERHKARWQTPAQGNQVLLTPEGQYLPGTEPRGKRYRVEELLPILDRALQQHPGKGDADRLELSWFLHNPKEHGYQGHFGPEQLSRLDRKPMLTLSGPIPAWINESSFLRRYQRQFIWTRGPATGEARITVRQFEPEPRELATIPLAGADEKRVGGLLDRAWLHYMKVRPLVVRGYIDNPHGNWLKAVMEPVHREELDLRERAAKGQLQPPGR